MKAYFACNLGETPIDVIDGSTITEEYSETLDSASIRLAPLTQPLSIKPFQEVKLVEGNSAWVFLIDDFTENQLNNRDGGKIYSYSINLMSETKYLEKIQLPNVCITHERTKQTLWQAIQRFYRYCPKIKMRHPNTDAWLYNRFLTLDQTMSAKFDAPCADLQLSAPTLRQALTAVMSQIGCIPTVKNGVISYLDLRAPQSESGLEDVIVSRSQSSGSYTNSLVNASGGLLDSTGKSVSERLCFRDRGSLLLKQLQNLVLETRFPIYKTTKLVGNAYFPAKINLFCEPYHDNAWFNVNNWSFAIGRKRYDSAKAIILIGHYSSSFPPALGITKIKGDASLISVNKTTVNGYSWEVLDARSIERSAIGMNETEIELPDDWAEKSDESFMIFSGVATFEGGTTKNIMITDSLAARPNWYVRTQVTDYERLFTYQGGGSEHDEGHFYAVIDASGVSSLDMTKLCKEASARSGLSVDYLSIPDNMTIDQASQFQMTTVSYSIGDKFIRGFSDTYSQTNGWWDTDKPMVENLCHAVNEWTDPRYAEMSESQIRQMLGGAFDPILEDGFFEYIRESGSITKPVSIIGLSSRTPINPYFDLTAGSYATMFFDIEYQPIASPVLKFTRKGEDFPIEQYDSKQNGLSSVEKVSLSEYETIDRLGSDVLAMHQRGGELADLNTTYGDYTIFKRVISYRKNYLEADYFASKNYVLKNYFTAIQTKYRAYQYVDYSQSVERNECLHAFLEIRDGVCIPKASDLFEIRQNGSPTNSEFDRNLIDGMFHGKGGEEYGREGITDFESTQLGLVKSYRAYSNETGYRYLDESSITHSDRFIAFTALDFDNASKGIYVDGTYLNEAGQETTDALGGIPQRYYPAQTSLQFVGFTSKLHYFDLQATLDDVQALPKYDASHGMGKSLVSLMGIAETPLTYKDNAERLGETFDFEIINYIPEFSFNENLVSLSALAASGKTNGTLLIVADLGEIGDAEKRIPVVNGKYEDEFGNQILLVSGSKTMASEINLIIGCSDNGEIWFNFSQFSNQIRQSLGRVPVDATICLYDNDLLPICRFTPKAGGGTTRLVAKINDTQGNGVYEYHNGLLVKSGEATLIDCSSSSGWERNAAFDI